MRLILLLIASLAASQAAAEIVTVCNSSRGFTICWTGRSAGRVEQMPACDEVAWRLCNWAVERCQPGELAAFEQECIQKTEKLRSMR